MPNYLIKECAWESCKHQLSDIRRQVFINEQKVPEELEWDGFDESAQHVVALNKQQQAVATGRVKPDGHIGRMAVLKNYRQQGIGSKILLALLDIAQQQNISKVFLHAQVTAILFYERHGFVCDSEQFMDAGIPHKSMIKEL
ncbi:GNAT family acetyltransferase YjcF [hydrothermal vent metagenome]|uniref:GNAT family acetyltransferase YjcF n=1 Tax=hydrothermal vent metagenome TaxID=652676 RepID=A0A3B1AIT8_9ZZZZ